MYETEDLRIASIDAVAAPEQVRGEEVGPAADQFAFCVALAEALWKERPFVGASTSALLEAIRRQRPRLGGGPRQRRIRAVLRRGLSARPDLRFGGMDELRTELVAALGPSTGARIASVAMTGVLGGLLVLGTVGSTGLATGPHLHYEFLVAGRAVDPSGVDLPVERPLPEADAERFSQLRFARGSLLRRATWPVVAGQD